jgi:hypothetical protein
MQLFVPRIIVKQCVVGDFTLTACLLHNDLRYKLYCKQGDQEDLVFESLDKNIIDMMYTKWERLLKQGLKPGRWQNYGRR